MPELSVLIPARNERWLARTVEDLLAAIRGDTEIIVVLDGAWADPPLPVDEKVTVLYNPEPVGQRAATNQAARVAQGRWLMKLDAHCSLGEGFDVKLLDGAEEDWTVVPTMFNLHVFDRVCAICKHRAYQGPIEGVQCESCGAEAYEIEVVWKAKDSPETTAMRFDRELRFQYWGGYKERQPDEPFVETMSLLGACWALTRERYFALDICDEEHGSWGQQGTEVACKTWLSGGRLMCCRKTWFAHMFRTQGGDFGFPYPLRGSEVERARAHSRRLWLEGGWDKAVRPLSWLLDHFSPVPDWETGKGIVFYTDNQLPLRLAKRVQNRLASTGLPIASASLKPMGHFGSNVVVEGERGPVTMLRQIVAALEASDAEHVFMCEHDVLYHPSHFQFTPPADDRFYYNTNVYQAILDTGLANRVDDRRQVSGLCASRMLLLAEYRDRLARVEAGESAHGIGYEPGTRDDRSETWESEFPNVDLRHGGNLTVTKRSPDEFRNRRYAAGWHEVRLHEVPGWDDLDALILQAA